MTNWNSHCIEEVNAQLEWLGMVENERPVPQSSNPEWENLSAVYPNDSVPRRAIEDGKDVNHDNRDVTASSGRSFTGGFTDGDKSCDIEHCASRTKASNDQELSATEIGQGSKPMQESIISVIKFSEIQSYTS